MAKEGPDLAQWSGDRRMQHRIPLRTTVRLHRISPATKPAIEVLQFRGRQEIAQVRNEIHEAPVSVPERDKTRCKS